MVGLVTVTAAPSNLGDRVVRVMTDDGAFRVVAAVVDATVREAAAVQEARMATGTRLAELMLAAVLLRETIAPGRRVQVLLDDERGGRMVADSRPDGSNRGLVNPGKEAPLDPAAEALLKVHYTLANGDLHQGIISVPAAETMSSHLMRYLQVSEQVISYVAMSERLADREGAPAAVIGFVVQLLPEAMHGVLAAMTQHLESSKGHLLSASATSPEELIRAVLRGHPYTHLATSELRFGCTCSRDRMLMGIASLAAEELREMVAAQSDLELSCDGCRQTYIIPVAELVAMLAAKGELGGEGGMKN